jgi:DNA-directed RNA polymerase subunit RPC12/RpoP
MQPNTLRCPQCGSEMTMMPLGPIEGEEHGVHMKIEGMPAMLCPNGHKCFVAPTFPAKLLDELLAAPKLVPLDAAGQRGFLRRRYCCTVCGEALESHGSGRVEATRSVDFEGLDRFGVEIDLPSYRCPSCAREYVEPHDAMVNDLMKASARAFRSAQLGPG